MTAELGCWSLAQIHLGEVLGRVCESRGSTIILTFGSPWRAGEEQVSEEGERVVSKCQKARNKLDFTAN